MGSNRNKQKKKRKKKDAKKISKLIDLRQRKIRLSVNPIHFPTGLFFESVKPNNETNPMKKEYIEINDARRKLLIIFLFYLKKKNHSQLVIRFPSFKLLQCI